jgi:hypothetical protein
VNWKTVLFRKNVFDWDGPLAIPFLPTRPSYAYLSPPPRPRVAAYAAAHVPPPLPKVAAPERRRAKSKDIPVWCLFACLFAGPVGIFFTVAYLILDCLPEGDVDDRPVNS